VVKIIAMCFSHVLVAWQTKAVFGEEQSLEDFKK
jgi:hypothetical protein